jgi:hypothetical protein
MWQIGGHYQGGILLSPAYLVPGLLDGETDGFAFDATTYPAKVNVLDTGTPANDLTDVDLDASNLVQSGTSPKMVHFPSSPYVRWSPHNMFLNSGTPATQNVTLVVGFVYTVTVTGAGGGDITGSDGASGTATTGSPATFTATTTTGTFTLTGSLDTIRLNRGATATSYLVTTGAIRIGIPHSYDAAEAQYGVLVEPAATNILLRSQEMQTTWNPRSTLIVTADDTTAPDGSMTGDKIQETTASSEFFVLSQTCTLGAAGDSTLSFYVKDGDRQFISCSVSENVGGNWFALTCDLINVTITLTGDLGTGTYLDSSIIDVGGGWRRVSLTGNIPGVTGIYVGISGSPTGTEGYDATRGNVGYNGSSKIWYLWGAQYEEGAVASSYTPTVASTVTRAADNITAVATSFPLGTSHTAYISAKAREVATQHDALMLDANNSNEDESVRLYTDTSANILMQIEDGGSTQLAPLDSGVNASADTIFQITGAWATNDVDVSANGTAAVSDGTATMPTLTHMRLGNNPTPGNHLNGFIYKMVYVPRQVETDDGDLENWRYVA